MQPITQILPNTENKSFVKVAVVDQLESTGVYTVSLLPGEHHKQFCAMLAIPYNGQLNPGDRVLITGESFEESFIIGILPSANPSTSKIDSQSLSTESGASANKVLVDNQEILQVQDETGQIIFEYRPGQGKAVLSVPNGDLALHAPNGNIQMLSGKSIVCSSIGPAMLESATSIGMSVKSKQSKPTSLQINQQLITSDSEQLLIKANQADAHITNTNFYGKLINGTVDRAKWVYSKLENVIDRLIERTGDSYRHTEDLHQIKAGRVRTIVEDDYVLKSDDIDMRANKLVKVDGKQIHLG